MVETLTPLQLTGEERTRRVLDAPAETARPFFVTGGTLAGDAASYVSRKADRALLEALQQNEYCHVLSARQVGKSSLMIRAANHLRETGATVITLELTRLGSTTLTPERFYYGLLHAFATSLRLDEVALRAFWKERDHLGFVQRWNEALEQFFLPQVEGRLFLFLDEIDTVRTLSFDTQEFFAAIRSCYNRRAEVPALQRLTFCLIGCATPAELIEDAKMTPFNIGQAIELTDFTWEEARPLAQGLNAPPTEAEPLLQRILYWTGGHPYLTQRLCAEVGRQMSDSTLPFFAKEEQPNHSPLLAKEGTRGGRSMPTAYVDSLCETLLLAKPHWEGEGDLNLTTVGSRLLKSNKGTDDLLHLYGQVLDDRLQIRYNPALPLHNTLLLTGVVRVEQGRFRVRNRIYESIFNAKWLEDNLSEALHKARRIAIRRTLGYTVAVSSIIIVLIIWYAFIQTNDAHKATEHANQATDQANLSAIYAGTRAAGIKKQQENTNK